jgi:hypothetical protein
MRTALSLATALVLTSCTTAIRPVQCRGGPHQCNQVHDAKFCEYQVVSSEGADCAALDLTTPSQFCVVAASACMLDATFAVSGRHCRVTQLQMLREGGECAPGLPTFMAP